MSIVIYQNGKMLSDSQGEITEAGWSEPFIYQAKKIFTSPCNRLALGMVGPCLAPVVLDKLIECLINAACTYAKTGQFEDCIEDSEMFLTDDNRIVAMTRDFVFIREQKKYAVLPESSGYATGSVDHQARYLMVSGFNAHDALEFLIAHHGTVNYPIYSTDQSSLSPLLSKEIDDVPTEG